MGDRQGHGGQSLGGRVDEDHGVPLPRLASPLVPEAAPEVDDLLAAAIGAAGAAQLPASGKILGKRFVHGLEAAADVSFDRDAIQRRHRHKTPPNVDPRGFAPRTPPDTLSRAPRRRRSVQLASPRARSRRRPSARGAVVAAVALCTTFCVGLHGRQHHPANGDDSRRDDRPIPAELRPRQRIGGEGPRLGSKYRLRRADRIRSKRPRDLHVARLVERGKFVGRKGAECDVGLPRLGDRAHDHFTAGHFRQHAPTHRCGRCQQTSWPHRGVRLAAEEHLTRLEDGADNRRLQHVHLTRGRECDVRRRIHTNVVTFCNVGDRQEAVEQWIIALDRGAARVPVAPPGHGGVAGIGSSGDADPQRRPPGERSCARQCGHDGASSVVSPRSCSNECALPRHRQTRVEHAAGAGLSSQIRAHAGRRSGSSDDGGHQSAAPIGERRDNRTESQHLEAGLQPAHVGDQGA